MSYITKKNRSKIICNATSKMNFNIVLKNKTFLKIVYLIRSILYIPLRAFLLLGNLYSRVLKIIDRRNSDVFWLEIMQESIDANISKKIKISSDKEIKFYYPSNTVGMRVQTFFTKEPETIEWMNEYGSEKKILFSNMTALSIFK